MTGKVGRSGRLPMLDEHGNRVHPKRDRSGSSRGSPPKKGRRGRAVPPPATVAGAAQHGSSAATRLVNDAKSKGADRDADVENERDDAEFHEDEDGDVRLVKRRIPAVVRAQIERVKTNIRVEPPHSPSPIAISLLATSPSIVTLVHVGEGHTVHHKGGLPPIPKSLEPTSQTIEGGLL